MNADASHTALEEVKASCRTIRRGRVSVIVPTYNRAAAVAGAIDSVLAQTHPDVELIVVDDGSTDGTIDTLASYGNRLIWLRQENLGPGAARNTGVAHASGEWVAFLDSDDRWLPDKLTRQVRILDRTGAGVCFTNVWWRTGGGSTPRTEPVREDGGERVFEEPFDLILDLALPNLLPTLMVRKSLLQRVGGFDERFPRGEDNILIFRLAFESPFAFIDDPLVEIDRMPTERRLTRERLNPDMLVEEHFVSILIRSEAYFRCRSRNPLITRQLRRLLGSHMARIAVLHTLQGNRRDARRFARDAILFAGRGLDIAKCLGVLTCPMLVRAWARRRLEDWREPARDAGNRS